MNTKTIIASIFILLALSVNGQKVSAVYKTTDLIKRIDTASQVLVLNFWATWCKPCVQELPAIDSLNKVRGGFKVLLVSLDFKEDLERRVNHLLQKKNITTECVLLDEVNGNDYINRISKEWSGAIPATVISYKDQKILLEKQVKLQELESKITEIKK